MTTNSPPYGLRTVVLIIAGCATLLTAGCSGGMHYGATAITSLPTGAEIINLRDDTNLGKTPARIVWKGEADSSEQVTIQLQKNGYHSTITSFWVNKRHATKEEALENATDVHAELTHE